MKLFSVISSTLRRGFYPLLGVLFFVLAATACETIYDDRSNCFGGVRLRFVYEYHMERGANAFPANVDCVTVYVFDTEGNYVTQLSETSDVLQDESYRMDLPLDAGTYNLLVYGGLTCQSSRFVLTPDWSDASAASLHQQDDTTVTLPRDSQGVSAEQLHDLDKREGGLFYGARQITLSDEDFNKGHYRDETVYLIKDTNDIQIILQELESPYSVDVADYDFKIVDDNFVLDALNQAVHIAGDDYQPCYKPYFSKNRSMGFVDIDNARDGQYLEGDVNMPVQVACAEFSTSRLFFEHARSARLIVSSSDSGEEIINVPLIEYLLLIQNHYDNWIKSEQEFLDRQSRWSLILFLNNGRWINTSVRISVNSWIVRLNNIII